jgi:hypothetical protein
LRGLTSSLLPVLGGMFSSGIDREGQRKDARGESMYSEVPRQHPFKGQDDLKTSESC